MAGDKQNKPTRRDVLQVSLRCGGVVGLGALGASLYITDRTDGESMVWQIDPNKCIQSRAKMNETCGNCAAYCVLEVSAVKCVHSFELCGFCDYCTGYFEPEYTDLSTAAENQLCPTGAIKRLKIEEQRFEYTIDEDLCIGCGRCVKGCSRFGNGSLFLQVRHDRCKNCNECTIAASCPAGAYVRLPASSPYLLKGTDQHE